MKICLCVCYVVIGIVDERGMLWVCIYTGIMSDFRNAGHGLLFLILKASWSVLACIAALYIYAYHGCYSVGVGVLTSGQSLLVCVFVKQRGKGS